MTQVAPEVYADARDSRLRTIGYGLLAAVASRENTTITYGAVYDVLAGRLKWRPRQNGHNWVNAVKTVCLEAGRINKVNDEPLLASLVRLDKPGRPIGDGYATAVRNRYGIELTTDEEIQAHADAEARKCWVYFQRRGW